MLNKWLHIIITGVLLMVMISSCRYPYNTPQARKARKEAKALARQMKKAPPKENVVTIGDSSEVEIPNSGRIAVTPDTPTPENPDSNDVEQPTNNIENVTITDSDSNDVATPAIDDLVDPSDSLGLAAIDSLPPIDSVGQDSFKIVLSPDSLSVPVQYNAEDSMVYDIIGRKVYLYGNAEVLYEQYSLKAGYIVFDFTTNVATAEGLPDSTGKMTEYPLFSDVNQTFDCRKIEYNFKTKKGKVYDASTRQGDGYFIAKSTKFISKDGQDYSEDDVIYSSGGIYTTCDHRHPHFGVRISRAKVVPNKVIVAGPAYLEIMGTPTPFALPFGFFPLTQPEKKKSGLIFSTNFDFSASYGPGIRGMGYYWKISDFMDLTITGDLYVRGSFGLQAKMRYNKRYHSSGDVTLNFNRYKIGERNTPSFNLNQDFRISWTHTQDQKAHPSQTFNVGVNFGTSDFGRNNIASNSSEVLAGTMNSNISYTKRFLGTPFTLSISMNHSQNTQTGAMNITLPRLDVRMNRITPFKRKNRESGKSEQWYERLGITYSLSAQNSISTTDSIFFDAFRTNRIREDILDNMEYRIQHNPSIDFSFKLFKYVNVQPNVRYSETWYFYTQDKIFDPTLTITQDTTYGDDGLTIASITSDTTFGEIVDLPRSDTYGFYPVRDMSAGVNLNTQFFAIGGFRGRKMPKGESHRLRLTVRPSVGFQWRPDYSQDFWGYYDSVQTDVRYPDELFGYRRFPTVPSAGKSALLTYNTTMQLDGKYFRKKPDTTAVGKKRYEKQVVLINNFSFNGNYNMAADSLRWSPVNLTLNTTLFKIFSVSARSTLDLYTADTETNNRINTFQWAVNKQPFRMTQTSFTVGTSITPQRMRQWFAKDKKANSSSTTNNNGYSPYDILRRVSISYNFSMNRSFIDGIDSLQVRANEISFSGSINLSKGWSVEVTRVGYDFANQRITYPDFTFARDLHCWQMGMTWQPQRQFWGFFIRVKPSSLDFINIPVRKNPFDPF